MRFTRNFGIALSDTNTNSNLSELTDLNQVSDWAKNDFSEAIAAGVFTGYQDNTIGSKKSGTRVESALVLLKFLQQTGLTN
ncbi:hypothetical protein D3C86_2124290 [compost metagenome]